MESPLEWEAGCRATGFRKKRKTPKLIRLPVRQAIIKNRNSRKNANATGRFKKKKSRFWKERKKCTPETASFPSGWFRSWVRRAAAYYRAFLDILIHAGRNMCRPVESKAPGTEFLVMILFFRRVVFDKKKQCVFRTKANDDDDKTDLVTILLIYASAGFPSRSSNKPREISNKILSYTADKIKIRLFDDFHLDAVQFSITIKIPSSGICYGFCLFFFSIFANSYRPSPGNVTTVKLLVFFHCPGKIFVYQKA